LPLAREERGVDPSAATSIEEVRSAAPRRILLVDDNADAASLLAEALRAHRHAVEVAYDGRGALVRAAQFRPDTALLDIGLPVMDGYQLAKRLLELPELGALDLIAVTGYGLARDRARAREAGFRAHLVKPVQLAKLLALLGDQPPRALH
jgi:CheY-like chemotaxis protein